MKKKKYSYLNINIINIEISSGPFCLPKKQIYYIYIYIYKSYVIGHHSEHPTQTSGTWIALLVSELVQSSLSALFGAKFVMKLRSLPAFPCFAAVSEASKFSLNSKTRSQGARWQDITQKLLTDSWTWMTVF